MTASLLDASAQIHDDGSKTWSFPCCGIVLYSDEAEPRVYAEGSHSGDYYNAWSVFPDRRKGTPISQWDTRGDPNKIAVKLAFTGKGKP
jgi:hypothetical protein